MVSFWFFLLVLFLGFFLLPVGKKRLSFTFYPEKTLPQSRERKKHIPRKTFPLYPKKPFPYTPIPRIFSGYRILPLYPVSFRGTGYYPEGVLDFTPKRYYPYTKGVSRKDKRSFSRKGFSPIPRRGTGENPFREKLFRVLGTR